MIRIRMIRSIARIALLAACLQAPGLARAAGVKGIQLKGNGQVELTFDGPVDLNQVKVEYLRDIVQLNLHNATIYPAKILPSSDPEVKKVFAYQYNPKLVRCRLSVAEDAEKYRDRVQLKANGAKLLVSVAGNAKDRIVTQKAAVETKTDASKEKSKETKEELSPESRSLLSRVLSKDAEKTEAKPAERLTGDPKTPSPIRSFAWLAALLLAFAGGAFVLKKARSNQSLSKALSRWTGKQFGRPEKMIDVIASHYLGPKKSIAVVKVKGQLLVVGISEESINLIAQLNSEEEAGDAFEQALSAQLHPSPQASQASQTFQAKRAPVQPSAGNASPSSYREQIRRKLDGMKHL